MKLIIIGSRDLNLSDNFIHETLQMFKLEPTEIVSGGAHGVDRSGENYVQTFNVHFKNPAATASSFQAKQLELKVFEADWEEHGKAAGPIRNGQMAEYADALLLIWDGESRGSANIKEQMHKANKPVYEIIMRQG